MKGDESKTRGFSSAIFCRVLSPAGWAGPPLSATQPGNQTGTRHAMISRLVNLHGLYLVCPAGKLLTRSELLQAAAQPLVVAYREWPFTHTLPRSCLLFYFPNPSLVYLYFIFYFIFLFSFLLCHALFRDNPNLPLRRDMRR